MNLLENEKNLKNLAESRLKEIQECNTLMQSEIAQYKIRIIQQLKELKDKTEFVENKSLEI